MARLWNNLAVTDAVSAALLFGQAGSAKTITGAQALSACIADQRLILNASIAAQGAAQFGLSLPDREELEC